MGWCYTTKIALKLRVERRQRYQEKIPIISWKLLFVIIHLFVVSFISLTNFDKRLSHLWFYTLSLAVPFTIFPLFRKKIFYKTPPSYFALFVTLFLYFVFHIWVLSDRIIQLTRAGSIVTLNKIVHFRATPWIALKEKFYKIVNRLLSGIYEVFVIKSFLWKISSEENTFFSSGSQKDKDNSDIGYILILTIFFRSILLGIERLYSSNLRDRRRL